MATLTTSWQNVASYRFAPGTGFIATFYIDAKYSAQSQANNTTTIQTRLTCAVNQGYGGGNGYKFTLSYGSTKQGSDYWTFENETITTGSGTITHNADGTKSISLSAYLYVGYTGLDHTMSTTVTLPTIKRASKIDSFNPNNDDVEGNFVATYTKYVNNWENRLRISIPGVVALQTFSNYASGSVVTLNQSAIERIQSYMNTNHTRTVSLGAVIETWNGGTKIGESSELKKTHKFYNDTPTYTYLKQETDSNVISILGDDTANTVIENVSKVQYTVSPTGQKGATIANVEVINGTNSSGLLTTSPYIAILPITSSTTKISVTDVRTANTQNDHTLNVLAYKPVQINASWTVERVNPTSSDLHLDATITYKQATYNQTVNEPVVQWMFEGEGTGLYPSDDLFPDNDRYIVNVWNTLEAGVDYTIDTTNDTITINKNLINVVPYTSLGTFYLRVSDIFTEYQDKKQILKGIPTMDIGEHDLQVNGDLYIADVDRNYPMLINPDYQIEEVVTTDDDTNHIWGKAIKYKNGLMIQSFKYYYTKTGSWQTWGSCYSSGDQTIAAQGTPDFPVPFVSVPICTKTLLGTNNLNGWLASGGEFAPTATNPGAVQIVRGSSGSGTSVYTIGVIAIGMWK